MKALAHKLEKYLGETLDIPVALQPWEKSSALPLYLRARYRFYMIDMLGVQCVLMADAEEEEQPPAVIAKHLEQARSRFDAEPVYVRDAMTSYNRMRLIQQKVPFIVPGNQMYLPMLGIDLREHLKRLRGKRQVFSPSTQALILYVLERIEAATVTPAQIANRLGYSAMTMTRAFDELETAGIGEHTSLGKERHLGFAQTGRPLWEKVLPYLNTPVRKHVFVASPLPKGIGVMAGLSALSRYTTLAEPKIPIFALSSDQWKHHKRKDGGIALFNPEPGGVEVEIWKYDPAILAHDGRVDRLSLFLSLKDSTDERVQSAVDALMGGMQW